jgi:hypothetical protein
MGARGWRPVRILLVDLLVDGSGASGSPRAWGRDDAGLGARCEESDRGRRRGAVPSQGSRQEPFRAGRRERGALVGGPRRENRRSGEHSLHAPVENPHPAGTIALAWVPFPSETL